MGTAPPGMYRGASARPGSLAGAVYPRRTGRGGYKRGGPATDAGPAALWSLSSEDGVNTREHQFQVAPWQLADALGELPPVDGDDQRDIRNRILGKACSS